MALRRTAAIVLLLAITVSVAALARMPEDRKARALLQEGRSAESVNDLQTAIDRYQQAFNEAVDNRTLQAEALLRQGMAYQRKADAKAASFFDRIVQQYSNTPAAAEARKYAAAIRDRRSASPVDAGYVDVPELKVTTIWQDAQTDTTGRVSTDGRYLSFVNRREGDALAVRDLVSRSSVTFSKPGAGTVGASAMSRDGKRIAYAWRPSGEANVELRVVNVDGLQDRLVYSNAAVTELRPTDWTPTDEIVALLSTKEGASNIETIALNRKTSNLKRFAGPGKPGNMTVSPDGHFIAYDAPQPADPSRRDIFTLSVEGGFVEHAVVQYGAANDTVLGWITDSKLLFASDREGTTGVWAIDVIKGEASAAAPIRVNGGIGEIHSLGMTRGGSLIYGLGESQVRVLENIVPELSRLQLAALQRSGQPAIPILGAIEGIVVKRGTNEPIPGGTVELARLEGTASFPLNPGAAQAYARLPPLVRPPELPPALAPEVQYASTGDSGRFVFRNLKPGGYRLVAKEGSGLYYTAQYGQRDPRGPGFLLPLGDGETFRDAKLEMAPMGVITGRVFDPEGRPLGNARVDLVNSIYQDGRRVLVKRGVLTNERGDYRLSNLPPGRYTVAASYQEKSELWATFGFPGTQEGASPVVTRRLLPGGDIIEETYGLVYYGNVLDPNLARYIELGLELSSFEGADIRLSAGRKRSHHIRGVLINGVSGQPATRVQVRAVPRQQAPTVMISFDVTDAQGTFDLFGVVPGEYEVFSFPFAASAGQRPLGVPQEEQLSGYAAVEVGNGDVESLRIVGVASLNLEGRASIEGRAPGEAEPDLTKMKVLWNRNPAIMGMGVSVPVSRAIGLGTFPDIGVAVGKDGSFALPLRPGDFQLSLAGMPPNAFVKSMRMGATDILTEGLRGGAGSNSLLEIVISAKSGELAGAAVNAGGVAMPNVIVALVPDSPLLKQRSDLYRSTSTDARGRFKIQAIPPGSYKAFAWEYVEPGIWHDAQFMRTYEASGKPVRIIEGQNPDVQLTVTPVQKTR